MAEKNRSTYENIHKQLSENMQDVYINDLLKDVKEPDIDLSFLTEDNKKMRKCSNMMRVASIVAVTIIVLLGGNIALLSSDSIDAYGDKGILHRIYKEIDGIFTDKDETENTDVTDSFETTEENEIGKAKKFFDELYIPEYIPSEYFFKSLSIQRQQSGDCMWSYLYSNEEDIIEITGLYYGSCNDFTYQSQKSDELITLPDRKISVAWSDTFEEYYVTIYTETGTVEIGMHGYNNKEELINIAKNLQK